ncbi:MAG: hypothetical protein EP297_15540 [Gammaproteobacteria bacterium]|nr:MAG: hypothetical protein EP297_15540 [Gammaproteobacteria bacterium]
MSMEKTMYKQPTTNWQHEMHSVTDAISHLLHLPGMLSPPTYALFRNVKRVMRRLFDARVLLHLIFLRPVMRIFFRAQIASSGYLRDLNNFILVSNHNSHLDTPLLYMTLPISQIGKTRPVAAIDYFSKHPILLAIANFLFRPVWIERDEPESAMKNILDALDTGDNIILYPEGTRGIPGKIGKFKSGITRLLRQRPDIHVVPAFLQGTDRSLPRGSMIPHFHPLRVNVGAAHKYKGHRNEILNSVRKDIETLGHVKTLTKASKTTTQHRVFRLAIFGIDGCGKSTLSRQVAREMSHTHQTCLVTDTLEFYEDGLRIYRPSPWLERIRQWVRTWTNQTRSLKSYKIPKLIELLLRDYVARRVQRSGEVDAIVMDGSPLINLIAWAVLYYEQSFDARACKQAMQVLTTGTYSKGDDLLQRFPELAVLTRLRLNHLLVPDATVFLDIDPVLAIQRIKARNKHRQVHENKTSLAKLRDAYIIMHRLLEDYSGVVAHHLNAALGINDLIKQALPLSSDQRSFYHE